MFQVLLIVAATVQLRMYSSTLFSKYSDVFVEEPEEGVCSFWSHKSHQLHDSWWLSRYKRSVLLVNDINHPA